MAATCSPVAHASADLLGKALEKPEERPLHTPPGLKRSTVGARLVSWVGRRFGLAGGAAGQ